MIEVVSPTGSTYASINVENFGPISKGEVQLRPLTVFTGRSNTGKSWFASLVYALLNSWYSFDDWASEQQNFPEEFKNSFPENPNSWAEGLARGKVINLSASDHRNLQHVLANSFGENFRDNILQCFGLVQTVELIRYEADSGMRIDMRFPSGTNPVEWNYKLEAGKSEKWNCVVNLPNRIELPAKNISSITRFLNNIRLFEDPKSESELQPPLHYRTHILDQIVQALNAGVDGSAWYLPANRGGIMHAHQVVVRALIRNSARSKLDRQSPVATLSGISSDFLENLITLARYGDDHPDLVTMLRWSSNHAENMEKNVLDGRINVEKTAVNYPRFSWTPRGWNASLALANVSSMVSELAPIVLYLRHFADKGDVLILEEPEAHLHPALQVQVMRQVAEWVRAGIRVILTTHSEWILEELSNLVCEAIDSPDTGLPRHQVALCRFAKQTGKKSVGSVIQEIPWDIDEGGYESGFMDVAADLHNKWANLARGKTE